MKNTVAIFFMVVINLGFESINAQSLRPEPIECDANLRSTINYYDCSNKNLTWSSLKNLLEYVTGGYSIDLSHNKLTDIDKNEFSHFANLHVMLNLSNNQIERISNLNLPRIKILDLSNNRISSIEVLASLSQTTISLEELYLNGNQINAITADTSMVFQNLKVLHLSQCNISHVDLGLFNRKSFPALEYVDLGHNNIQNLKEFDSQFDLPLINLIGNRLKCDCNLLWYKRDVEANKQLEALRTKYRPLNGNLDAECFSNHYNRMQNVLDLNDHLFQCRLDFTMNDLGLDDNEQTFECIVAVFPKVNFWWSFGEKVLSKTNEKNPKYSIKNEIHDTKYFFELKSKLSVRDPNSKDNGDYVCHVSYSNDDTNLFFLNYTDHQKINKNFTDSSSKPDEFLMPNQDNRNLTRQIVVDKNEKNNILVKIYKSIMKNQIYFVSFLMFSILLLISLVLICIMCVLMYRNRRKKSSSFYGDNLTIKQDLSIDEYDRLNQSKIREHVDVTSFAPQYSHHHYSDYTNVSRDDDALSSVCSIKNYDTISSLEENLDDYQDPLLINIRKPNQNSSSQK
jgi:hypothetical protein